MKRIVGKLIVLIIPLMLTGCWDIKDVQDVNYLSALGLDYKDGKFVVYGQMLDFSAVAKTEAQKPVQPISIWIGVGKGERPTDAVNDLYPSSQMRVFFGHVAAFVISENILKEGRLDDFAEIQKYYEMRYTPWFYATNEPIDELFAIRPFFNLSPTTTLLYQPWESYRQRSRVQPLTYLEFVSRYYEPAKTTLLPSLGINKETWRSDGKFHSLFELDGVYVFHEKKYLGRLKLDEVPGLHWVNPSTVRHPLEIREGDEVVAMLSLESPKIKIEPKVRDGKAVYTYNVNLSGFVSEKDIPMSEAELEKRAEEQVREEIRKVYEAGLAIDADLLGLEHALYRQKNKQWKRLESGGHVPLTPESLEKINVTVRLDHSGKFKNEGI